MRAQSALFALSCLPFAISFYPVIPAFSPVIPAKAGIQKVAAKPDTRNQVQTAVSGSLLPLWEKG